MHSPHLELAKKFWIEHLEKEDVVIDATCGGGRDTLFLCGLGCKVFAFDIQKEAILRTEKLLGDHGLLKSAELHLASHARFPHFDTPPRLIVYNLGYLPGGDKGLTTMSSTTLESLTHALQIIPKGGAISITCYPGHLEGEREERAIVAMIETLPSNEWLISHHRFLNRPRSPNLIWVVKGG